MADDLQGQVTELEGDPDADHVEIWIHKDMLPGVMPGDKVQVISLAVPPGAGFRLLLVLPEEPPAP